MREIFHVVAMALIVTVAAGFTLVQVSDVDHAVKQLGRDEQPVIRQVDSNTSGR